MYNCVKSFGVLPGGIEGKLYRIKNQAGIKVMISNVAAAIVSIFAPDRDGNCADIVLGYGCAKDYLSKGPYHGACIGRIANRIENATFTLNGIVYHLPPNYQEKHVLHGGFYGLDSHVFDLVSHTKNSLCLETVMEDGEDGFSGNVKLQVTYTIREDNGLSIRYYAVSDADTVLNLTNHAYFNLAGEDSGCAMNQMLQIFSNEYLPLDEDGMVCGLVSPVDRVMDFRTGKPIIRDLDTGHPQIQIGNGYDHTYILKQDGKNLVFAARAIDELSGRVMEVHTNMPSVLLYTGNFLGEHYVPGKNGRHYQNREGFCLETGFYPNALRYPQFPQPILRAGEIYDYETVYRFTNL